jgi:hypothetical protein
MTDLFNKKIKEQDQKTKDIEKQFYKENQLNVKQFVS